MNMFKFYRPARPYFVFDFLILLLSYYIVLEWFPLTTEAPFNKYSLPTLFYTLAWILNSYIFKRYKPLRTQKYFQAMLRLVYTSVVLFIVFGLILHFFFKNYSGFVLLSVTLGVLVVNYTVLSIYFAYRFAVDYNDFNFKPGDERIHAKVKYADPLDEESYSQLCSTIRLHSTESVLKFLQKNVNLLSGNTYVYISTDANSLQMRPNYQYSTFIQLERLNNMREINKKISIINEKLPDNGIFICCFESKSTRKKRILDKNIWGFNYIIYMFDFLYRRAMPRFFITKKLYYFLNGNKNRILSKAEVFGRLYCCGYKVVLEKKINQLTYVIAERIKQPELIQKRIYGPLIRLHRYGQNGIPMEVYKLRTMHPYSEYLQNYMYEKNRLNCNGKFYKDIRITTLGGIFRKYWLDELPMIFNLLKDEIKIVGVRPLSGQYFSLYSKELQDKRNKYKPGLLPPFYADMPQTLEEIQQSEMKYLLACEKNGIFSTDFKYFFLILKNILINRARSG